MGGGGPTLSHILFYSIPPTPDLMKSLISIDPSVLPVGQDPDDMWKNSPIKATIPEGMTVKSFDFATSNHSNDSNLSHSHDSGMKVREKIRISPDSGVKHASIGRAPSPAAATAMHHTSSPGIAVGAVNSTFTPCSAQTRQKAPASGVPTGLPS